MAQLQVCPFITLGGSNRRFATRVVGWTRNWLLGGVLAVSAPLLAAISSHLTDRKFDFPLIGLILSRGSS